MRERQWSEGGREELTAAVRATFPATRFTVRGERRAVGRMLEPTERVLAVTICSFEIARHEVVAHRSLASFAVFTDRRLLFARKMPFRPARIDEVARTELRDAELEVELDVRRVVLTARDVRVTMRHMLGRDALHSVTSALDG